MTSTTTPPPTIELAGASGLPAPPRGGHPRRESVLYLALVYGIVVAIALAIPGTVENPGPVSLLTLLTPACVVGLIRLVAKLRHAPADPFPIGFRRAGLRSWPAAVALPLAAMAVSFGAAYAVGVVTFDGLAEFVLTSPLNIAFMTILVLGEEIGWRGYLLPRLATVVSPRRAALVTGFAQGLFHLPLLLLTPAYDGDGNRWIVAPGVVVVVTAAGATLGWLRIRSGSIWPAAIAHATVNTFLLEAPVLVTDQPDLAAYLTGEGGVFTVLVVVAMAAFVLRRCTWTPRGASAGPVPAAVAA